MTFGGRVKILMLFLVIIAAVLFTACSDTTVVKLDPEHPVTLIVWHYYNGPQKTAFDEAVREFNETEGYEKGIIVEAVSKNSVNQLAEEILASAESDFGSSELPNIFGCYGDSASEMLKMDKIVALDDYIKKENIEEYLDSFVTEGKLNTDHLYIFPIAKSTESIFLNKTDFDKFAAAVAGAPYNQTVTYDDLKTWEGIKRVGNLYNRYTDDLTGDVVGDGLGFFGIDSSANYLTCGAMQLGYDIAPVENGKLKTTELNNEIMKRLFDIYYTGTVEGAFVKKSTYASDDIKTGNSIAMLASTTGARYFPSEVTLENGTQYPVELMVLPMPVMEGGEPYAISQGAGMSVIKATPEEEYASTLFLLWFTEENRNVNFSIESGYLPVKKTAINGDAIKTALDDLGNDASALGTVAALETGISQIKNYKLCYSNIFDGSIEHRKILQDSLIEFSNAARADAVEKIRAGSSLEEIVSKIYSDGIFDTWLTNLENSIKEAVNIN